MLTLLTFFAYAVIYTVFLKPATPMNIVIGGASGAMPPVLGWAAVTNQVTPESLILFLIIFCWTPPHFWALALYRRKEYEKVGMPMLPVTHGEKYTRLQIVLYTIILVIVPLFIPVCKALGIDLIHFGVLVVVNSMIGLITPPYGILLFVINAITGISLKEIISEIWMFIGVLIIALIIMTLFPGLILWLPEMFGYKA